MHSDSYTITITKSDSIVVVFVLGLWLMQPLPLVLIRHMILASIPCHPMPCTSESEHSRSIADNTLKLSTTSWRLVSLEGPHCSGGNLSCSQCNRQLPRILIGIMYH